MCCRSPHPPPPSASQAGRRRLLADLDAEIESRALEVIALRPEQAVSAPWLLEDTPRVPRHLAAAVAAAAGARGARAYRIDPLLYAALGPAEMARDEIAASVRADIERTTPGMSRAVLSGTAWLPEEVPGRAVLGLCLERLEARARRQSGSTERQVRDVFAATARGAPRGQIRRPDRLDVRIRRHRRPSHGPQP
jgi:hypothetical protein